MASGWCVYILWVHKTTLIVDIASWVTSWRRGLHCNAMECWINTVPCGFETQEEGLSVKVLHCYKRIPLHSVLVQGGIASIHKKIGIMKTIWKEQSTEFFLLFDIFQK